MIRIILLVLLPFTLQAAEPSDPWLIVERAAQAAHRINYKGIIVYQSGSDISSSQMMHINYGNNGEFTRVIQLDGEAREILSQDNNVVIYQPKSEKVVIDKRRLQQGFPAILPRSSRDIRNNYKAKIIGSDRISGRESQVVMLESHDQYRYHCKIWVDRDSGLPLKITFINNKDEIVEQVAFSQLILANDVKMDWFHPKLLPGKDYIVAPEETVTPTLTQNDDWAIGLLPPGFHKTKQVKRNIPGKQHPVNQLVFGDGLASVSLFIEPQAQGAIARTGNFSQGATNVYINILNGYQIVVLGEVPSVTLMQISKAITFRK